MTAPSNAQRVRVLQRIRFGVLAAAAITLGHAAVYVSQYGIAGDLERAMRDGGHGGYWTVFSVAVAAAALLIVGRAALRLVTLTQAIRRAGAPRLRPDVDPGRSSYPRELWSIAGRLLPVVLVGFTVQENVEHILGHGQVLGFAPLLGDGHPFALPVLAAVSLAVAAAGALVRWRTAVLIVRLARVKDAPVRRRPAAVLAPSGWWLTAAAFASRWIALRRDAGRAPPTRGALAPS